MRLTLKSSTCNTWKQTHGRILHLTLCRALYHTTHAQDPSLQQEDMANSCKKW